MTSNDEEGVDRVIPLSSTSIQITGSFADMAASIMTNGDTVSAAIEEKRCIQAPIGCGQALLKEDGTPRFDHFPDSQTARLYEAEWMITGLCPPCQDGAAASA